jgi:hypothetical protein
MAHTEVTSGKEAGIGILLILGAVALMIAVSVAVNKVQSNKTATEKK